MPVDSPLLRPRDTDALRAELRHVAAAAGLPVTFGGEVRGAALLLTEFVGTQNHSMRGLAVRPSAGLGGATMVARRPMSWPTMARRPRSRTTTTRPCAGRAATEEVREVHAQLRRLAADPSAPPALRVQLRVLAKRLARGGSAAEVTLSPRELDVLAQVALGCTNNEVAQRLSLKPETVKGYLRSATAKLGAHTRHEAVAKARRARLLP